MNDDDLDAYLRRLCHEAAARGAPQLPLFAAAQQDLIGLVLLGQPDQPWPTAIMRKSTAPCVALIGDDPAEGGESLGPRAWACVKQLRWWQPVAVMVHASAAEPSHYRLVAAATMKNRRVVLVETSTNHALAWGEAIGCSDTLYVLPKGGVHPLPADARVIH